MKTVNLFLLLSYIITLLKFSYAGNLEDKKGQFYLITVKHNVSDEGHVKRQENNPIVDTVISEIHNLIVDNKDSYINPEKLNELDGQETKLKKRSVQYLFDYGESNYVYPIAKYEDKTIVYGFLTKELADKVSKMDNISGITPDKILTVTSAEDDISEKKLSQIKLETGWEGVSYRSLNYSMSLVSQGEYDSTLIDELDNNYYYPSSAGEGIDIFFIDGNFDFSDIEFSNTDERVSKCILDVIDGKVQRSNNNTICYGQIDPNFPKVGDLDHGTTTVITAAGRYSGAAPKANVYGVSISSHSLGNYVAATNCIEKYIKHPNKTILSLSIIFFTNKNDELFMRQYESIERINNMGAVVFVSAGNDGKNVYDENKEEYGIPCMFNNTICVGGTDDESPGGTKTKKKEISISPYRRSIDSNFGKEVDIYAPYIFYLEYKHINGEYISEECQGTSYSCPVAAGVAATLMSDKPGKYNRDIMLKRLQELALKNVVGKTEVPNYFLNNGHHSVYSMNDNYKNRCGPKYKYKRCSQGLCCSAEGICGDKYEHCSDGCQSEFGSCYIPGI